MRHQARRIALEAIYRHGNTGEDMVQALNDIASRDSFSKDIIKYAEEIVAGIKKETSRIDEFISKHIENWDMNRLSLVDLAILRIGAFEILNKTVPYQVAIDEAVKLAKEYGGSDSFSFINGILDAVRKEVWQSE